MPTSRRLQMTERELSDFLTEERVLRLATVGADGWPVVVPLWFVWHDDVFWISNLDRASRTERLRAGRTRVGVCVDGGSAYEELRGATCRVEYEFVSNEDVPLAVRTKMGRKYFRLEGPIENPDDHTWLRLRPVEVQTWDFRKVTRPS